MAIIRNKQEELIVKKIDKKAKHKKLVEIGVKLLKRKVLTHKWVWKHSDYNKEWEGTDKDKIVDDEGRLGKVSPIYAEPQNISGIIPDVIGWSWGNSVVIECKTSRSDFL